MVFRLSISMNSNKKKIKVICFLGGPGSGKGTQCERLVSLNKDKYIHLSTEAAFMKIVAQKSHPKWKIIDEIMKSGNLVTRELSREILKDVLLSYANENKVILLDGYPSSMENIDDWDNYMIKNSEIKAAIYLNCKIEAMKTRLKQEMKEEMMIMMKLLIIE